MSSLPLLRLDHRRRRAELALHLRERALRGGFAEVADRRRERVVEMLHDQDPAAVRHVLATAAVAAAAICHELHLALDQALVALPHRLDLDLVDDAEPLLLALRRARDVRDHDGVAALERFLERGAAAARARIG